MDALYLACLAFFSTVNVALIMGCAQLRVKREERS